MLAIPIYDDAPRTRPPVATVGLIAACSLVFLWQVGLPHRAARWAIYSYGMVPALLFGSAELPSGHQLVPAWMTLITSQFLHGGVVHLLGNVLYLWIFGRAVEAGLGFFRYLLLYLGCGVIAGLTQAYLDPNGQVPMIGASGAIAGALGAYFVLNPRGNVAVLIWIFIFVRVVRLPAVLMLGLWFLLQLASALSAPPSEPGVAFWAHVGGFVAGLCLVVMLRPPGTRLFGPRRTRSFSVAGRRGWGGPWG